MCWSVWPFPSRCLSWSFEEHVAQIYAIENRLTTHSKTHAVVALSLRQAAIDQQGAAIWQAVWTFQWEQMNSLWEPIESKARPTNQSILLKGIIVHQFDPRTLSASNHSQL
jgi:hypothetical protein